VGSIGGEVVTPPARIQALIILATYEWTPADASKIATVIREVLARREPSP
jgi:hypothetical protein